MSLAHSPRIITDGLVLCLDAANPKSYPGSGTTWTDLSGNGNNGTLVNGVGYSGSNLGSLSFDGVDDKILVSNSSILNPPNITFSIWVKRNTIINYSHFAGMPISNSTWGNPYIAYGFEYISTTDNVTFLLGFSNNTFLYNTTFGNVGTGVGMWYNAVGTYDGQFSKIYINGQLINSIAETRTLITSTADFVLGQETSNTSNYNFNGNIAQVSIYNKALTASEIQQNYNATKSRYS